VASAEDIVLITGANGLVGSRICGALSKRGVSVRAVVRRAGTSPDLAGVAEVVGDFTDPDFAATLVSDASAVVTTVHPMGSDRATQHRIARPRPGGRLRGRRAADSHLHRGGL
jgi:uncharacterized protein YbjT (DUF2867 family)